MKKFTLTCLATLLVALAAVVQAQATTSPNDVEWALQSSWKLNAKPLDLAHSYDNKKIFILEDDQKVHVYSTKGRELGYVPVDKGVSAIDISPKGKIYLIDEQKNTFSSMLLNFIAKIDVAGSPFQGNKNAPVTLVVFSDFQ